MPNKIHHKLKQLAKEILEMDEPYNYHKVYEATLLLFERLILIKNAEDFNKDFCEDLETNFDQTVEFFKTQPSSETTQLKDNNREEIVKEVPETKTSIPDFFQENTEELSFERKEVEPGDLSLIHI